MKRIQLNKLTMINFRAIKRMVLDFTCSPETVIRGANKSGKSTTMMAFNWLLFDKDQFGKEKFEIKPLLPTGDHIHNLDTEVSAEILVENEVITLKKIFHEVWSKPKGKAQQEFKGHETLYFFNEVPLKMSEYNRKVSEICPEELFRLLTNPLYFPNLAWEKQRKILIEMAGEINSAALVASNPDWQSIITTLNGHKTLDEYKKEIAGQIKKIKEQLSSMPARLDETQRNIPLVEDDWDGLQRLIDEKNEEIRNIDQEISDLTSGVEEAGKAFIEKQRNINEKKTHLQELEHNIKTTAINNYQSIKDDVSRLENRIKVLTEEKKQLEVTASYQESEKARHCKELEDLRSEWHRINKEKEVHFLEEEYICPTCKRLLDETGIEKKTQELIATYNANRAKQLETNTSKGKAVKVIVDSLSLTLETNYKRQSEISTEISDIEKNIEEQKSALEIAKKQNGNLESLYRINADHQKVAKEIVKLEEALGSEPRKVNISDQTFRKDAIQKELEPIIKRLGERDNINRSKLRVEELLSEQRTLAQKQASLERIEFNIQGFVKAKIEAVEGKINSMFSFVKFRMYKEQVNGGEAETCELMVDGVPFSALNNAAKYQSGLDVIRTLSKHYQVCGPIWLDNREGITEIPEAGTQVISLYVDPLYKQLSIN
jgi:chromosome segregation ATPase